MEFVIQVQRGLIFWGSSQREAVALITQKKIIMKSILIAATTFLLASNAYSAVIYFDILGKGGAGMLSTNENHAMNVNFTPGTGGEMGAGIFFDDVTKVLTLNFGWGSANGFMDLSKEASAGHIHGPTTSGGVGSFTQNAGVMIGLDSGPTWNPSATSGGVFNRTVTLNATQEAALLAEKTYLNIHTNATPGVGAINPAGEIRGNLVIVPEPSQALLSLLGLVMLGARRKR